jgi:hypothetical protein
VDVGGLAVRQTLIGVELATPDGEIVLGLTDDEAEDLYRSLDVIYGVQQNAGSQPASSSEET